MKIKSAFVWTIVLIMLSGSLPAAAGTLPDSAYIAGVTGHAQQYVLSCESRSAADWAAFWGVSIDESEFQSGLPSSDNPDLGFVGSPNDGWGAIPPASYGVHAEPVASQLRAYGLQAQAAKGLSWNDLRAEIAAGRPVIVWVIGQMWGGTPVAYTAGDGSTTTVARFEHTVILFGYDESHVHIADAYSGWNMTYPLETFLASWAVLGNMAVTGQGTGEQVTEIAAETSGKYTVQRGDYLAALADRFDVSWQTLAQVNGLVYPYIIYPGQELSIPGLTPPEPAAEPPAAQPTPRSEFHLSLPLVMRSVGSAAPAADPTPEPRSTPAEPQLKTYTVQLGDFLIGLADQFGVDWRVLADLNDIDYPYVIYPGQVINLP